MSVARRNTVAHDPMDLMVVLSGDHSPTPVINTGSLDT
jgi:hypothetical protein